jgi:uncharacterized protein YcnI
LIRGRYLGMAAATIVLLGVGLSPAWSHPVITQKSVPANSDQGVELRVPDERGAENPTSKVLTVTPESWKALKCDSKPGWDCQITAPAGGKPGYLTWSRPSDRRGGDIFKFSVRTGGPGRYPVPVNQTYSDGQTVRWNGPEDSENPAPVIDVT